MSAQTEIKSVSGYVVPIGFWTRVRVSPSTYTTVVRQDLNNSNKVNIDQIVLYLENDPNLTHVRKGDLWGRVTHIDDVPVTGDAWIAIDYHNASNFAPYPICTKHYVVDGESPEPDPEPEPSPAFPESFTLVEPDGRKAFYQFVRIIEDE